MKKKMWWILLIPAVPIALVVMAAIFWILVAMKPDDHTSPVFFSLDDPKAYYSITKTEDVDQKYPTYGVVHNNDEVYVGNSKVALDPFVGKRVIIKGKYSGRIGDKQCIVTTCHPLGGAMIDIDSVSEVVTQQVRDKTIEYTVVSGDTLPLIAEKFGISIETIRATNKLHSDSISEGQVLQISP